MKKIFKLIFLVLFLIHNLSAEEVVKIGSIGILTGEGAAWGIAAKNGIDLAVEKINSQGGVLGKKIKVYHQDDQGDPKKAISAFKYLTDIEGVKIIIGPSWSNTGLALVDLSKNKRVIMISPSLGVADFNEAHKYLFNTKMHDFILSRKLAEFVREQGHTRVALIGAQQVWVIEQIKNFKEKFEELGGEIVFFVEPLPQTTDLKSDAQKIKNLKNLDAVVSMTNGIHIGSYLAKYLKQIRYQIPKYSIILDQEAIDVAQGGFENLKFITSFTPSELFKKQYEKQYNIELQIGGDSAYDAVMLLSQAIEKSKSFENDLIAQKLAEIEAYQGVSGKLISDGRRGFTSDYKIQKVVDGKPTDYKLY